MTDAAPPPAAGATSPTPAASARWLSRAGWAVGIALVLVGWAGGDRWFYEHVSLQLNTDNPYDRDFYQVTKPVWNICRYYGHVVGGLIAYFAILAFHRRGWRWAHAALLGVLGSAAVVNLLQGVIGRLRPNQAESAWAFAPPLAGLLHGAAVGFPSGEAGTAFAVAWVLTVSFPRGRWLFLLAALLTTLARVLPGMHYISDVAAGAMVGTLAARWLFGVTLRYTERAWPVATANTP